MLAVTTETSGLLSSAFGIKPLRSIGLLSYGIYMWQQPLVTMVHGWSGIIADAILLAAVSVASYRFIEQPALRLRDRMFSMRKTEFNSTPLMVSA